MDPNSLNNLDPKLRETYERVMGTTTPPASAATVPDQTPQANPQQTTTPTPNTTSSPSAPPNMVPDNAPVSPMNAYTSDNLRFQASIQAPLAGGTLATPETHTQAAQSNSSLLRILYIIGAIVFFIVYTIFWIKIFKLPAPF
ncbi:MAG TPA: hypothetical protein VE090_02360 [Methylomirabilota bacterium]|nr:hypothetical protein [Methylomirabilota bacterium]